MLRCAVWIHTAIFRSVTPALQEVLNEKNMACGLVVQQKIGKEL
jgi:hypothetical protein